MPYTPPSQRSPATSKPNSPILSRNHSYTAESSPAQRPSLPRSVSSTSYISKHRRSPSLSTQDNTTANGQQAASSVESSAGSRRHGSSPNGSIRPSPYVSKRLMPPGAVTTPPDSSEDEEDSRGRKIGNLRELHEALQHIDVKREHSPNREDTSESKAPSMPVQPLSAEARKMSHSRSTSEITLSMHTAQLNLNTHPIINSSSENSDVEDDELRIKPPLVRKKSGELVKPALRPAHHRRPSSMPGTPTFTKAVHFGANVEQVRHFQKQDRPMAVSAGSSPVETYDNDSDYPWGYEDGYRTSTIEWEITLSNFPRDSYDRKAAPVRVEKIFLAFDHKTLIGTVAVANIAFHKLVVARFTLDYWKTTSEVVAEYNHDVRKKQASDGYDRFNFSIKLVDLANLETKTMFLCVRYNVNGQDYWDNNNSMNYQIDFAKKTKGRGNGRPSHGLNGSIPRSRHSPSAGRPRSTDDDDLDFEFGNVVNGRFNPDIRLKPKSRRGGSMLPDEAAGRDPTAQAFSSRYDWTNSLPRRTASRPTGSVASTEGAAGGQPISAVASVPGLSSASVESPEYNELIQRYCFYGTPTGKGSTKASVPVRNDSVTDGSSDQLSSGSSSGSSQSSTSNSPASPAMSASVDGANDAISSSNSQHFLSRSTSPGPVTGSDMIHSPLQYGYSMHGGIFPERSPTPQACV